MGQFWPFLHIELKTFYNIGWIIHLKKVKVNVDSLSSLGEEEFLAYQWNSKSCDLSKR